MDHPRNQRHAFVVRLWQEEGLSWRGWVQHVGSQEQTYLGDLQELLAFIERQTGAGASEMETPAL